MNNAQNCVFCQIIAGQSPAHIVYESDTLTAFLDIEPIHEGHVLIVPRIHTDSIDKLPESVLTEVMKTAQKMVSALREVYGNEGYGLMQNGGRFCDFGHAHFHVFPRYENDGFGWNYPKEKAAYSAEVAEKIRRKLTERKK